jgi:hypothetical protein
MEITSIGELRNAIQLRLKDPSPHMFNEAQEHIFELMKNDSFRKFRNWEVKIIDGVS